MTKSENGRVSAGSGNGYGLHTTIGIANHDPTRPRAPGYSFGLRYHERDRPTPGPQYNGSLTARGPSFSITGRPRRSVWDSMASSSPGPSSYTLPAAHQSWEKKAPMYSIGAPYRPSYGSACPAPNSYFLPTTLGSRVPHVRGAPATSLHGRGSDTKSFSFDHAKTPGPAGYGPVELSRVTRRAPAVTLKGRPKLPPIKVVTPGPGAYEASVGSVTKSSPRYSMGVRHGDNVRPMFTMADVSE